MRVSSANAARVREYFREYYYVKRDRQTDEQRERRNAAARKRYSANRAKALSHASRMRIIHADKYKARYAVRNALRNGVLKRLPCSSCGAENAEAHHEDYSKPLSVEWLCRKCHGLRHRSRHA